MTESVVQTLRYIDVVVFTGLAVLSLVRWRRWRAPGSGWVAAAFSALAAVSIEGLILPPEPTGVLAVISKLGIVILLFFPYFLFRFAASFDRPSRWAEAVLLGLAAASAVWSLLVRLPAEGEPRPAAAAAFILAVLTEWTVLSTAAAIRLWRAGHGEPTPGRRRLRLLSVASLVLSAAIILAGAAPADGAAIIRVVVQITALGSALLFFVGLFPPRLLQIAWRRPEESEFRQAIGELMTARDTDEVVSSLLPHMRVVAGGDAAILDEDGKVIGGASGGAPRDELPFDPSAPGVVRIPLRSGSLVVRPSPFTPFFRPGEVELLEALGALADLALERVEAERTVRDQAQMIDLAPDGIFVRDLEGRIGYWNRGAEELYGYSKDEALGKISHDLLSTRFPLPLTEIQERLLRDGRWEGDLLQTRRDGSEIVVSSRWAVRTEHGNGQTLVLVINNDITEQRAAGRQLAEAKEEAERASEAKSEFLSRMSHELRTPLNAILGFGQLLQMQGLNEEQQDSVEEIVKAGRHLLELINEVLEISRIEAGKLAISLEPVPVRDLVAETLSLIRPLAEQRELTLGYQESGCEGQHVLGDFQRLKQVVLNLLSNAVKYNVDGGSVHLTCGPGPARRLRIAVTDTGRGIPAERLGDLFEPFERLGAEQTSEEGTGLGLALSKRLVEAMGGAIGVESAAGRGSTFWIDLQRATDPAEAAQLDARVPDDAPRRQGPSRTALYIEDNLSNLKLIERVLSRRPEIKLIPAMHGGMGLDLARQHRPSVILLDLQLPDMSGKEVLRRLKAERATWDIPVVVISADATKGQIAELMAAGAHAYLTKPLDVQGLLRLLDEPLDRAGPPVTPPPG